MFFFVGFGVGCFFFLTDGFVLFYGRHAESETLHFLQISMLASLLGLLASGVPTIGSRRAPRHWHGTPALQKCHVSVELTTKLQIASHPISASRTPPCIHRHPLVFSFFPQHRRWSSCSGLRTTHENTETTQAVGHSNEEPFGSSLWKIMIERHCNAKSHISRIHSFVLSELKASLWKN